MAPQSVISTTLQLLRDKLVDNSFLSHPLFRAIEGAGNLIKVSGGLRVEQPVIFGEHSSITQLSSGFEPVSMAVTDPFQSAKFEFSNFTQPIILNAVEKAANKGDLAVVNILESKMRNVMLGLKKEVSKQVIRGNSTVLTSFQTLNGMTAAPSTGWLEGIATGTQQNVVGGLSKVTYRAQNWFNNFKDSGGTLSLSHLDELFIQCQIRNPSGAFPDILLMSPNCFAAFQALQQSFVRYTSDSDRKSLDSDMVGSWRGARIYVEPNLGFTAAAPAKPVSAYALSSDQFQLYADTDGFFNVSEMQPVPGTATEAAQVFCRMQLVTGHLASHGVLLDAEA
jgi:hypothetical protein|tara:strand:- start:5611 stop:6621 length:1011 start_codon:yes stop_codon:yes gene_type:complete